MVGRCFGCPNPVLFWPHAVLLDAAGGVFDRLAQARNFIQARTIEFVTARPTFSVSALRPRTASRTFSDLIDGANPCARRDDLSKDFEVHGDRYGEVVQQR